MLPAARPRSQASIRLKIAKNAPSFLTASIRILSFYRTGSSCIPDKSNIFDLPYFAICYIMNHLNTPVSPSIGQVATLVPALATQKPDGGHQTIASLGNRLGVYLSLLISLRAKHAPTAAHSLRVAQNLSAWSLYYQLPVDDAERFELAGLLHDIGKIGIPERILQKPSKLLPEERLLVDVHPQVGLEILRSAGVHSDVTAAVQQLGFWYDRSNCSDPKIALPITQRILSIADAFDAMTSEQTFRRAMSTQHALDELRRMSGRQFDPKLVDSFAEVVTNATDELRQHVEARWRSNEVSGSMVQLFQQHASTNFEGSMAIKALNQVFHRQMMDHMNDGVIFVDTETRILEWNKAAERFTGLNRSAIMHSQWVPSLVGLSDDQGRAIATENCPIQTALRTGKPSTGRFLLHQNGGNRLRVEAQLMPIFDHRGTLCGGAMLMGDATEQAGLEEKVLELHVQATQDSLTKVANRAELNRCLPTFVAEAQKSRKPSSILICDIDFFKRINDTFGHAAGDEALKVFASVLKDLSRESDLVARYGGEEFVILCDNCDLPSAIQIGETIRHRLHSTPVSDLKGKCMTASFGVSDIVEGDGPDDALERADKALLQAKQTGRDRVVAISGREIPKAEPEEQAKPAAKPPASTWLSWLGSGTSEPILTIELLSSVPRGIAIEKIKGFIADSKADIIDIQPERVHLKVDCRFAPMARRDSDRPTVFELKFELDDVDVAGSGRAKTIQRQTRLKLEIHASRHRDRRTDAIADQATRLRLSFQSYLSAQEIDDKLQERLIPVYKPGADGR